MCILQVIAVLLEDVVILQRHVESATASHSMGGWYVTKYATCTATGTMTRVCSKCGYTENTSYGPNGHNYASATCTNAKYCKTCGIQEGPSLGHNWGSWTTVIAATCVATGQQKRTCTRCGKTEYLTINMKGHTWGDWSTKTEPTCISTGEEHRCCSVCTLEQTNTLESLGHNYEVIDSLTSSCTNDGYKFYECTRCGDSYTETLDELGHKSVLTMYFIMLHLIQKKTVTL